MIDSAATERSEAALQRLASVIGDEHVLTGTEDRRFFGQDVHHAGAPP